MKNRLLTALLFAALLILAFVPALLAQVTEEPAPQVPLALVQKVIIIAAGVTTILQGVKRMLDNLAPGLISGAAAIVLNLVLSAVGAVALADPGAGLFQLVIVALTAAFSAAGAHNLLGRVGTAPKG